MHFKDDTKQNKDQNKNNDKHDRFCHGSCPAASCEVQNLQVGQHLDPLWDWPLGEIAGT
jgi:hypothetical protein